MGWEKVYSWDLGHMIKVATMSIYGKDPLKFFLGIQ